MTTTGEMVHRRLLAEGGFCWIQGESVTVHFNRGCRASAELRGLIKAHGRELKAWVLAEAEENRREMERLGYPPPGRYCETPRLYMSHQKKTGGAE